MFIVTKDKLIRMAMDELENMPIGGIGADGATQEELTDASLLGMPYEDDAVYHTTQQAWIYLNQALSLPHGQKLK